MSLLQNLTGKTVVLFVDCLKNKKENDKSSHVSQDITVKENVLKAADKKKFFASAIRGVFKQI